MQIRHGFALKEGSAAGSFMAFRSLKLEGANGSARLHLMWIFCSTGSGAAMPTGSAGASSFCASRCRMNITGPCPSCARLHAKWNSTAVFPLHPPNIPQTVKRHQWTVDGDCTVRLYNASEETRMQASTSGPIALTLTAPPPASSAEDELATPAEVPVWSSTLSSRRGRSQPGAPR